MTRWFPCAAAVALAVTGACAARAPGPPAIEIDRTACARCGMLVSERMYAAAYQRPGAEARVFDDIGCLLDAVRGDEAPDALVFWFHDAGSRSWIAGAEAVFVRAPGVRTPMNGGVLAYGDAAAARDAARRHDGHVVGALPALLERTGGGS